VKISGLISKITKFQRIPRSLQSHACHSVLVKVPPFSLFRQFWVGAVGGFVGGVFFGGGFFFFFFFFWLFVCCLAGGGVRCPPLLKVLEVLHNGSLGLLV